MLKEKQGTVEISYERSVLIKGILWENPKEVVLFSSNSTYDDSQC